MTDVTELFGEVVKKASEDLQILYPDGKGEFVTIKNPDLNYIFGNSQYIKDQLDTYSKSPSQSQGKFPLFITGCLMCCLKTIGLIGILMIKSSIVIQRIIAMVDMELIQRAVRL